MGTDKKCCEKMSVGTTGDCSEAAKDLGSTACNDVKQQPPETCGCEPAKCEIDIDIDHDVPLVPQNEYLVVETREVPQFTAKGLRVPSTQGQSVVCEVVATGPGRLKSDGGRDPMPYHVGQFVLCNPRNIELGWPWLHRSFQVIMAHAVVAVIPDEAVKAMEARACKFSKVDKIAKPPESKIVGADGEPV